MRHECGRNFLRGLVRAVSIKSDGRGVAVGRASRPGFEPLEPRVLFSGDPVILGDYDGNGFVSQSDLDLVLLNWGDDPVGDGAAVPTGWVNDLPTDIISQNELDGVLLNWGTTIAPDAEDGRRIGLTSGQTIRSDLGLPSDVDTWTIDAAAGDSLLLTIREDENVNAFSNLRATLFGPDGVALTQAVFTTGGDVDQIAVAQTGTYTLVVQDEDAANTGEYALTAVVIDGAVDADNTALVSGQTQAGFLDAGDIDTWTIDATAGESLLVTIREDENINAFTNLEARLFGPDGALIQTAVFTTGGDLDQIALAQSGRYTITLNDNNHLNLGNYTLTAVVIDEALDADNTALVSGQTQAGFLDAGDIDTFTIDASAGESLLVTIREDENVNAFTNLQARLFGPDGALIQTATFGTGGDLDQIALTQTGRYTITLNDNNHLNLGNYTLTAVVVDETLDAGNTALTSGQTQAGFLEAGDIDTFTIDAAAGESLLVTIREDENVNAFTNLQARLFGPDGALIQTVTFTTGGDLDQIALAQTGRYTITLNDNNHLNLGNYTLTAVVIDEVVDADNVALSSGVAFNGVLAAGDIDTFTINASAGDDLLIEIAEVGNNFTNLEAFLFGPDGALIQRVTFGSTGDLDQFALALSGTYTIALKDNNNFNTGPYTLTATVAPPAVAAAPPAEDVLAFEVERPAAVLPRQGHA